MTARRPRHCRKAFTLLEALLASVVLAASITAVTLPMTVAAGNEVVETRTTAATHRHRATRWLSNLRAAMAPNSARKPIQMKTN